MIKQIIVLLLLLTFFSCSSKKSEEVLIRNLKKASELQKEKNQRTLRKVESYCEKNLDEQQLCLALKFIETHKEKYLSELHKTGDKDYQALNRSFVDSVLNQLTAEEKSWVLEAIKASPLIDSETFSEIEGTALLDYELNMEAEVLMGETYKVLLKDYSKTHKKLDWHIIYDEQHHIY